MAADTLKKSENPVSIIIPTLNSAGYLRECVDSVLCQTLEQIEVLCVDAGSDDGTLEILDDYAARDARVHVVKSDRRSYGYQVNLGIRVAHGEYIGIVESDDYIAPAMYQALYACAERNHWPDFVKGGFICFVDGSSERFFWKAERPRLRDVFGRVIRLEREREKGVWDLNHIWSGIYRRSFIQKRGIWLHESPGASYQDLSFSFLTGLLADTAVYIEDGYYYYRRDNEGSSVKSTAKWRRVMDEFQYTAHELTGRGKYSEEIERLITLQKPEIYFWNASRLPERERDLFFAEIQPEMDAIAMNAGLYSDLSNFERVLLETLRDQAALDRTVIDRRKRIDAFRPLAERIRQGETFVLVGTGRYGECLASFQKLLKKRFIEAVADNAVTLQGSIWYQYTVLSVQAAAEKYKGRCFIAASKLYHAEIKQQLIALGIREERILTFQTMISESEFIELLTEKAIG